MMMYSKVTQNEKQKCLVDMVYNCSIVITFTIKTNQTEQKNRSDSLFPLYLFNKYVLKYYGIVFTTI